MTFPKTFSVRRGLAHLLPSAALGLVLALGPALSAPALAQDGARHLTLLGIPSATAAPGGSAFASLAWASEREGSGDGADGSLALGFGVGDANEELGLQVTAQITSLTDSFADSGYFGIKASRRIASGQTPLYLAFSVDRLAPWGDSEDNDVSADMMVTGFRAFPSGMPIMFTLGAGTHVRDERTEPGAYAGMGFGLSESFAASAAYYGDHATVGMSWAPRGNRNLSVTASLVDAFDQQDDKRAVISINYLLQNAFGG